MNADDPFAELRREIKRRSDALLEAKDALERAILETAEFKIGDVVEVRFTEREEWREAIVRDVFVRWGEVVAYAVSTRNKGGEWSKSQRDPWDRVRARGAS